MDSLVRNITVIPYSDAWRQVWNNIVDSSRNGTFMHRREYVEYHRDRFTDCSLLALRADKPVAVLPANRVGSTLFSHQGLTFGGWISLAKEVDMLSMLGIFDATASFARANDICRIVYKPVPHIYCRYPAEEDLYALFRCNARLIASNVSTAIPLSSPLAFNQNARRGVKKALDEGISVTETISLHSGNSSASCSLSATIPCQCIHSTKYACSNRYFQAISGFSPLRLTMNRLPVL